MNLVDLEAKPAQSALLEIAREKPETYLTKRRSLPRSGRSVFDDKPKARQCRCIADIERDLRHLACAISGKKMGDR